MTVAIRGLYDTIGGCRSAGAGKTDDCHPDWRPSDDEGIAGTTIAWSGDAVDPIEVPALPPFPPHELIDSLARTGAAATIFAYNTAKDDLTRVTTSEMAAQRLAQDSREVADEANRLRLTIDAFLGAAIAA